jgi:WD40 repeat protein
MNCPSKISSLSWNSQIKAYLLSADYEGCITLWDANLGTQLGKLEEHDKRVTIFEFTKRHGLLISQKPKHIALPLEVTMVK